MKQQSDDDNSQNEANVDENLESKEIELSSLVTVQNKDSNIISIDTPDNRF